MSSGAPDLFVICRNCGSEVSPYITECPYCGNRLRKRAPRLERGGKVSDAPKRTRRPAPSLGPLRRGEIPGIRVDARPYATIALVVASLVLLVVWRAGGISSDKVAVVAPFSSANWWHVLTAPFAYITTGYAFVTLFAIAIFGWLIERRHGPFVVLLLFLLGGAGGMLAVANVESFPATLGGNGAALALVFAWAMPDVLDLRRRREIDGDLLGAAAFAIVLLLLPVVVDTADALAGAVGAVVGIVMGTALARFRTAR